MHNQCYTFLGISHDKLDWFLIRKTPCKPQGALCLHWYVAGMHPDVKENFSGLL